MVIIKNYTKERIGDVIDFEYRLRQEDEFWGWEIDDEYCRMVENSFDDSDFDASISLLAYDNEKVVGRIDACLLPSHFDGSKKAYLDWICVIKKYRHQGIAQKMLNALRSELKIRGVKELVALTAANKEAQSFYRKIPDSVMRDIGIWIDIK